MIVAELGKLLTACNEVCERISALFPRARSPDDGRTAMESVCVANPLILCVDRHRHQSVLGYVE